MANLNLALPGNPRYQPKDLTDVFGYDNLYRPAIMVEIATLRVLAELGIIPAEEIATLTPEVEANLLTVTTSEVDHLERTVTKHDVRALVRLIQDRVDPCLRRWVHVPLTSYDVLDTARALQFRLAHVVVRKLADQLIGHFASQAERYANTVQIGRTHGQHALPITVGFWFATILSRLLANIESANSAASVISGKISGAVGAYNAQAGIGIAERCGEKSFEVRVLEKLGLKPARISTQILPPEPIADYLFACMKISATLGQFGRDGRHLMRTEIAELGEPFVSGQVGSSTMAHKRNPINFENLEGTWQKNQVEFGKVLMTMVSEHQRDLVGSSIMRDFPIIVVNLVSQLNTLLREVNGVSFIMRLAVDEEALSRNLALQSDVILAEPLYIALQQAGYEGDAHELVNHQLVPYAKEHSVSLHEALRVQLGGVIFDSMSSDVLEVLSGKRPYTGFASEKVLQIVTAARAYLV